MELSEIELHRLTFMWRDQRLQHHIKEFYRYYLKFEKAPMQTAKVYINNGYTTRAQILNKDDLPLCFEAICNIINRFGNRMVITHSKGRIFWL